MFKVINIDTATAQGPRNYQEDRMLVCELPNGSTLLAVADGMGGPPEGDKAAQCIIDHLAKVTETYSVVDAIKGANRDCKAARDGRGSTVVAAHVTKDGMFLYNVGDSRGYSYKDGDLLQLTTDHEDPYGRITSCIGFLEELEVNELEDIDNVWFCLMTDGIFGYEMDPADIVKANDNQECLPTMASSLVAAALNTTRDNCTAISFQVVKV